MGIFRLLIERAAIAPTHPHTALHKAKLCMGQQVLSMPTAAGAHAKHHSDWSGMICTCTARAEHARQGMQGRKVLVPSAPGRPLGAKGPWYIHKPSYMCTPAAAFN